ncbi:MAG: aldo/keto reductase [Gemmatimonadota bacterium]|nr:aldo/keto reductase [Gemmatimonadota bacterium]
MTDYSPATSRYDAMPYERVGQSGVLLPLVSLGLWHNFGRVDRSDVGRAVLLRAFDLGITHFDLANNYGPPPGSAEETLGRLMRDDLAPYRDELIISTKAGYRMWDGPYGEWGSRKHLVSSLDQSLRRLGLDYVDIFYHHRPDPATPLEETMAALDQIVRSGKALYAGISSYSPEQTVAAAALLRSLGTPCLLHQPKFNMLHRSIEDGLLGVLREQGIGCIVFSPLAQGVLTDRYLRGIPADSRAGKPHGALQPEQITEELRVRVRRLDEMARARGQSLAQMALVWVLRHPEVNSAIIGASRPSHVEDAVGALSRRRFEAEELAEIDRILAG